MSTKPSLQTSDDLILCNACGTQYPVTNESEQKSCKICDDPRQYVPPEGQSWSTLRKLRTNGFKNVWWQDPVNPKIWSVRTEPRFAIGERAILIQTDAGNVLWDLIPFLDQETVDKVVSLGGISAIIISHPHYYSTYVDWSRTFGCPVYVGAPDREWFVRTDVPGADLRFLTNTYTPISGATAIVAGGHFPGSLLLLWESNLFIADTIFVVPSGTNPAPGKPGVLSFAFHWSIPNRIPLHPDDILMIWRKVKDLEFHSAFGAFKGQDVRTMENEQSRNTGGVKGRLLESCKIYTMAMGWKQHEVLVEAM